MLYRANRPALHFSTNDSIGYRSTGGHLEIPSINNQRTARVFIRFLAYFPQANLSSTSFPSIFWKYSKTFHQQPEKIQRLFTNNPKIVKDFSPTTRKHSKTFSPAKLSKTQIINYIPEIFKDFLGNQQQQSTAAINKSNQQQQSTAPINSSNRKQQSTAATSSSNQQQQPAAAINSSNQQHLHNPRRLPLVIITVPSRGYVLLEVDLGLAAR